MRDSCDSLKYVRTKRSFSISPSTQSFHEREKLENQELIFWGSSTEDMCKELFAALEDVWLYYNSKVLNCMTECLSKILDSDTCQEIFNDFSNDVLVVVKEAMDKTELYVNQVFDIAGDKLLIYKRLNEKQEEDEIDSGGVDSELCELLNEFERLLKKRSIIQVALKIEKLIKESNSKSIKGLKDLKSSLFQTVECTKKYLEEVKESLKMNMHKEDDIAKLLETL